jgi:hypothetical protein
MTVAKLRGARERKRREAGKCEGRKSHAELNPELVALAKRLRRQKPKGGRMSLRAIAAELATQGFLNENGRPFAAAHRPGGAGLRQRTPLYFFAHEA